VAVEEVVVADLSNPQHAAALIFLLNEYAKDPMGGSTELSDFVKENLAVSLSRRQGAYVILAFVNSQPAGLINCFEGFSTFACKPLLNIHDVIVLDQFRGCGLSGKLLAKAEELAVSLGCCKLTLEVLEVNTVAQAAYASRGYSNTAMMFWQKKL
jgi:GNAT superfamily N-acetyltransferase